jgi:hypothetical protein
MADDVGARDAEKVWSTIRWSSASGTFGGKDSRAARSAATLGHSACTSRQSSSSCVVAREREAERQVGERAAESGDEQDAALLQLGERELVPLQRRRRAHDQRPAADAEHDLGGLSQALHRLRVLDESAALPP